MPSVPVEPASPEEADVPRVPAVWLRPAAELAPHARQTTYLRQVEQLARWAAGRHLTKRGRLRVKDARVAASELGLSPPSPAAPASGAPRGDTGQPAVQQLWQAAVEAELVELEDKDGSRYAGRGPALELLDEVDRGEGDPEDVLDVWGDLLEAAAAPVATGLPTMLGLYLSPEPISREDLVDEILASPLAPAGSVGGFALGDLLRDMTWTMTTGFLDVLEELDAVETTAGGVRLTDLGLYGVNGLLGVIGLDAPAVEELGEATAQEMVELANRVEDPLRLMTEWVAVRPARTAAEELLVLGAEGGPTERMVAITVLDQLDATAAEPAVRDALDVPEMRGYAISWLLARELPAPETDAEVAVWVLVDGLAARLDAAGDDEADLRVAIPRMLADAGTAEEQGAVVARMGDCDHPSTAEVLTAIRTHHRKRAVTEAAGQALAQVRSAGHPGDAGRDRSTPPATAYQLKISLRDVRPPVWRRVVVPGSLTLADLHRVIQVAMGWDNSHLHEFEIAGVRYGEPDDDDFGWGEPVRSEWQVRLDEVAAQRTKLRYTYDFGDDWRHEVLVEEVRAPLPGERLPVCLAGRRACPPEDVGGAYGYDNFLAAYDDPSHPEHDEYRTWVGRFFAPADFDRDETTSLLQREL